MRFDNPPRRNDVTQSRTESYRVSKLRSEIWILGLAALLMHCSSAWGQSFDSGSDGSDGALVLDTPGVLEFDPRDFSPPLDPDGDGIYHFTTVDVAIGVTVRLRADRVGHKPLVWLATGEVTIRGTLDLRGDNGPHGNALPQAPAIPGPGGYHGGVGSTQFTASTAGEGPGGGQTSTTSASRHGGGAGHMGSVDPGAGAGAAPAGEGYGNAFLLPMLGGSGGGGGGSVLTAAGGAGGGAGGGAMVLASSTRIRLDGTILADGGSGGQGRNNPTGKGGGGSGGALRLVSVELLGTGTIQAFGGNRFTNGEGANGRVRIETFRNTFTGTAPGAARFASPGLPFLPQAGPQVRLVRVNGQPVPAQPQGRFDPADLNLSSSDPVSFEVEANDVPLGTIVQLQLVSEAGDSFSLDTTPLAGTLALSTATASAVVPPGFSRVSVRANWTP